MSEWLHSYDFCFSGPMADGMQSIPLGNGEMGANVWYEEDGALRLLISRTDCWSESMRLLKAGLITLRLTPNPFQEEIHFRFSLADATLHVFSREADVRLYMDANAPCLRARVSAQTPTAAQIRVENYRDQAYDWDDASNYHLQSSPVRFPESADSVFSGPNSVGQYHCNQSSCYRYTLKTQSLEHFADRQADPLLRRVFGCAVYGDLEVRGDALCGAPALGTDFSVYSLTLPDSTPEIWRSELDALYAAHGAEQAGSYAAHAAWWQKQWADCYVHCPGEGDAHDVARAFLYQRYMNLCAGGGEYPIKFNGSIFTAGQPKDHPGNYDARNWGAPYWIQNTRLIYWAMLACGDYRQMQPMLKMCIDLIPISRERVRRYYNHEGMLLPETFSLFGTYACSNYGYPDVHGRRQNACSLPGDVPNPYIRWHFNGMVELAYLMLRYVRQSGDNGFLPDALAFCREVLLFFLNHFGYLDGRLLLAPVSSLETWQNCANDTPDIAGLTALTGVILSSDAADEPLRELCRKMQASLPALPIRTVNGKRMIAPCETKVDPVPRNVENAELYPVFPFDLYGLGKPDLAMARDTYAARVYRHDGGWSTDPVWAARLGLTDEAERHILREARMVDKRCVFPAFWGPNFDETPDQDHGSVVILTIANMLLQPDAPENLFPAWPKKWDVEFRLPSGEGRYIHARLENGKLVFAKTENT